MNNIQYKKEKTLYHSLEYQILKTRWKNPWWKFGCDLNYINLSKIRNKDKNFSNLELIKT